MAIEDEGHETEYYKHDYYCFQEDSSVAETVNWKLLVCKRSFEAYRIIPFISESILDSNSVITSLHFHSFNDFNFASGDVSSSLRSCCKTSNDA